MPKWTLKQLETFVWLAKLESFRRTAERLNTTQPNISVRIAGLEEALGVRLFDRDGSAVTLTPKGQSLLGYAERALSAIEEFSAQSGRADEHSGVLRIGVSELIAQTWLRHYLRALKSEFPFVDAELTVGLSINLRNELADRSLDLGLLNGPITDFNIDNVDLGSVPLVWVAAPGLSLAGKGVAALAGQTILTHARHTRSYIEIAAHFREHWDGQIRMVSSGSLAACLQMTLEGLGVAALPRALVRDAVEAGELAEVPYAWTPSPLTFSASYQHTPASHLLRRAAELAREIADSRR